MLKEQLVVHAPTLLQMYLLLEIQVITLLNYIFDGTTSINVTAFTSGGNATHGVVVLKMFKCICCKTITGTSSSNQAVIQANVQHY